MTATAVTTTALDDIDRIAAAAAGGGAAGRHHADDARGGAGRGRRRPDLQRRGLVAIGMAETGLSDARLTGELKRTAVQLRLFADVVLDGGYLGVRIDDADADFALGARPTCVVTGCRSGRC